jgi:hypothetical protein
LLYGHTLCYTAKDNSLGYVGGILCHVYLLKAPDGAECLLRLYRLEDVFNKIPVQEFDRTMNKINNLTG